MKGTASNALIAECGEIPLSVRSENFLIKCLLKLHQNDINRASEVLVDKKFFQFELNNASIYIKTLNSFLTDINCNLAVNENINTVSPWFDMGTKVDLSFSTEYFTLQNNNKNISLELIFSDIVGQIEKNFHHVFFVDGSVSQDSKVGAAFFCPTIPVSKQFKLPKGLSVYFSESFAILQAI